MGKTFQQSAVKPNQLLALVDPFLFSNSSEVKRDALHGLASLAKTEENKENIGNVGGVSALASLIFGVYQGGTSGNRMKTIGSSSNSFATERTTRKKEKVVHQPDMIRIAAETLSNLLTHPANQEKFFHMQGIEKSVELCFLSTKSSLKRALTKILHHLTSTSSRNRKMVLEARGTQGVFKLLSKVDEENNVTCFTILKKLSSEADFVHKWEEDIIEKLTGCLRMSYGTKCNAIIILTIANIMEASPAMIEGNEGELFEEILTLLDNYNHVEEVVSACLHCLSILLKSGTGFDTIVGNTNLEPINRALVFQVHTRNYANCKKIIESLLGSLDTASVRHFTSMPSCIENIISFVKEAWKKDVRHLAGKLLREVLYKVRDDEVKFSHCYGILSILLSGADTSSSLIALEILADFSSTQKCFDFCVGNAMSIIPKIDDMGDSSKLESVLRQREVLSFLLKLLEDARVEKFLLHEESFGYTYLKCLGSSKDSDVIASNNRLNARIAKDPTSRLAMLVEEYNDEGEEGGEKDFFTRQCSATRIQCHWRGYSAKKRVSTLKGVLGGAPKSR